MIKFLTNENLSIRLFCILIFTCLNFSACTKYNNKVIKTEKIEDFQFVGGFYPSFDTWFYLKVDVKDSKGKLTILPMFYEVTPSFKISTFKIDNVDLLEFTKSIQNIDKYRNFIEDYPIPIDGMIIGLYYNNIFNDTIIIHTACYPENSDFEDYTMALFKLAEKTITAEPYSLIIQKAKSYMNEDPNVYVQCEDPYYAIFDNYISNEFNFYREFLNNIPKNKQKIFDFRDVYGIEDSIASLFNEFNKSNDEIYYLFDSTKYSFKQYIPKFNIDKSKIFFNYDTLFSHLFNNYPSNIKYYPHLKLENGMRREGSPVPVPDATEE